MNGVKDSTINERVEMQYRAPVILLFFVFAVLSSLQAHEDFIICSPPKCGTHLISRAMELITHEKPTHYLAELGGFDNSLRLVDQAKQNHSFVVAHNLTTPVLKTLVAKGYKIIFILRDPRDQLVSMLHWFKVGQWNWLAAAHVQDQNAQITELITGGQFGWRCYEGCIGGRLARLKHLDKSKVMITYFENLVGKEGGRSSKKQRQELKKLAGFIGLELSEEQVSSIVPSIFGNTWSFRKGEIGAWKEYFTKHQCGFLS